MDPAEVIEATALAKQQPMLEAMAAGESEVQRFYKNCTVFVTGGSGFLGKQLIEKLFRSCQISKVYMLLRPKKGKDIQQRLKDVVKDTLFDTLRKQKPEFSSKIVAIDGDVSEIGLGIKDVAWKTLTEEVDVIFHVAATTRFDEPLRTATLINVRGAREALLLGKACNKLRSYVHVSTAYTHATTTLVGQEVYEEFYKSAIPPADIISMAESMDADRLSNITLTLIKDWPNTYTFTKSISEELVRSMSTGMPICIVRPGIVLSTYSEPCPGWLDQTCVYGASGYILGTGLGVLHSAYTRFETALGLVPCDYVNNAMIVAARETASNQAKGGDHTKIYTVTSTQRNPVTWQKIHDVMDTDGRRIPSPRALYYNFGTDTSSKWLYLIVAYLFQFIPAYFADFVALLMGKQRRFVKMSNKVFKMCNTLSYFTRHEWKFMDTNTQKLFSNLSSQDQAIFNFNITDIDWTEFILVWCIGVRKYIVKDGLKVSVRDAAQVIEDRALVRTHVVNEASARGCSQVQRFYKNCAIFLTGGSGFLGKQLIEKIFRSCNVSKLYILMRPKKGKQIQQRLDDLFKEPVFDSVRKLNPDFTSKIIPVAGDVSELRLGIKDEDWKKITEEVNVIFHVAATTKFDESIRVATLINVRGTREALTLGRACKNLKSYVHVSTAYTHATAPRIGDVIEEEFGESPIPPHTLISLVEQVDTKRLDGITAGLIKDWPNTYTFTKTVAEELVRETSEGLPICIVRPGIVICSFAEPAPGWLDISCVYGSTGFLLGLGLGLVHTIHVNFPTILGFIPVDMVNNAILAAARETACSQSKGGQDTRIYTVSTNNRRPISWQNVRDSIETVGPSIPTPSSIYYAFAHDTSSKFIYYILSFFLHFIPAYVADFVCLFIGKERRFTKIVNKLYKMCEVLSFFLINEWKFMDNNLKRLYSSLSSEDRTIFNFDVTAIEPLEYISIWCVGTRKYIVKDGLKGTDYGIRKQKILRWVHYAAMGLYMYGLWKLACFAWYLVNSLLLARINVFC